MDMRFTLAAFGAVAALTVFCLWRGLSATKVGRVRMIPWTPLGLLGVVTLFMLLIHLLNLAGMETGRR
jgi:hypothetical protein